MAENHQYLPRSKTRQWRHVPLVVQVDRDWYGCTVYPAGDRRVVLMIIIAIVAFVAGVMIGMVRGMQIQARANAYAKRGQ